MAAFGMGALFTAHKLRKTLNFGQRRSRETKKETEILIKS